MNKLKTKGCQAGSCCMYNMGAKQLRDLFAV